MRSWTGLDPGGTEHLWDPNKLIEVLEILDELSPFSHMDPNSPIYPVLSSRIPSTKWFSFDKNEQFRPIFRRTNPWTRLGLTEERDGMSYTSPIGHDLLEKRLSIAEVLLLAAQSHVEANGDHSFPRIANALLEMNGDPISSREIILGLMDQYESLDSIGKQIHGVRNSGTRVSSDDRRKRNVSGLMNILVSTGGAALAIDSSEGWILRDRKILEEIAIADPSYRPEKYSEPRKTENFKLSVGTRIQTKRKQEENQQKSATRSLFNAVSPEVSSSFIPGTRNYSAPADPQLASLRLERANRIHAELVADIARNLIRNGLEPVEDLATFDVAVFKSKPCLIEVKSVHPENSTAQIRKAISQLLEYRWIHKSLFESDPRLLILVNESPVKNLIPGYIDFLRSDLDIEVLWKSGNEFNNEKFATLYDALNKD